MTLRDFIREHRKAIDAAANAVRYRHDGSGGRGTIPTPAPTYNDEDRRQWVLNDQGLYNCARSEGVKI